uniref:Protein kinase (cAMP-dependent, catalytic) inhibitor gamma n=1 Tax=Xiphophorus couchianus TaxID=32473 RepID=A0A3B5MMR0_9TELE
MMDVETSYSDFINCDRTGRRNAVPDITGEGAATASTSELTKDMAEMDLKAAGGPTLVREGCLGKQTRVRLTLCHC